MNRWLFKTEPSTYSFQDLLKVKKERWDGVHNPVALKNLRLIKKGDSILIYHTGEEKTVVGIAEAVSDPYPDPKDSKLVVIDIAADKPLQRPVTLAEVKSNPKLASWELARLPRLSVMPVNEVQWKEVVA